VAYKNLSEQRCANRLRRSRPARRPPASANANIATVIVAPMTTKGRDYPSRVNCQPQEKDGQIVLDQIRTVDT
jgi:mRNA interferase MazF